MTFRLTSAVVLFALLVPSLALPASVKTFHIKSQALQHRMPVTVVLPAAYKAHRDSTFPVIFLLHGYGADHNVWRQVADLAKIADSTAAILVCPTAGPDSWYLDSPVRKRSQAETFMVAELLPAIDKRYRTRATWQGRALVGSSMGGHGAVTLLARHTDLFACAGSISGLMDLRQLPKGWGIASVLGPLAGHDSLWAASSFVGLAYRLKGAGRAIVLVCGSDDQLALAGNRDARRLLTVFGVACEYLEPPGSHTRDFVSANLGWVVASLARTMRALPTGR
jgi:S-formylglutathione hydrolase FrmB